MPSGIYSNFQTEDLLGYLWSASFHNLVSTSLSFFICRLLVSVAIVRIVDRLALNLSLPLLTSQYNVTTLSVYKQPIRGKVDIGAHLLRMNGRVHNCHCPLDSRESDTFIIGGRLQPQSGELTVDDTGFIRDNTPVQNALWKLITMSKQSARSHCVSRIIVV